MSPRGRSLLFSHGRQTERAYVLLHGITASPGQMVLLANRLFESGANVAVPRLPHHGHRDRLSESIAKLTTRELKSFSAQSARLAGLGEHCTIVGFSAGGLLAVWLAQHAELDRVVAIAPFLGTSWCPPFAEEALINLALVVPNLFLWWDPRLRERQMPAHGYPRYATHSVANTWRLAFELFAVARLQPPKTRDIGLVTNSGETTVNNAAIARLARMWRKYPGINVTTHRLPNLPPSHDIIEPLRNPAVALRVYPEILTLLKGASPGGSA